MTKPAARIGDMHVCPMVTGLVPHVGGPIILGCFTVLTGKRPQARVTDPCVCVGPPDMIAMGSPTVFVGGLMAARIGDPTVHGGKIVTGLFTVLIGEQSSGGGGGGGGAGADGRVSAKADVGGQASDKYSQTDMVSEVASALTTSAAGLSEAAAQARALVAAAVDGKPFCVRCAMTAVARTFGL